MAKEYAKQFYASDAWQRTRNAYYKLQRGMCERCKREIEEGTRDAGNMNPGLIVHHKKYITPRNINDPKVTLSFDNLELLCEEHHNKEHKAKEKRYRFAKDGSIIPF